jgi:formate hydrogenlyase subunit 3/multisubunit Na+/H+ antiporter MnhD subunit
MKVTVKKETITSLIMDFCDMIKNGILFILAVVFLVFCLIVFLHTFFILAGFVDILYQTYHWSKVQSFFPIALAIIWLGTTANVINRPKHKLSTKLYWLLSILFVLGLHLSLFTTKIGLLMYPTIK